MVEEDVIVRKLQVDHVENEIFDTMDSKTRYMLKHIEAED